MRSASATHVFASIAALALGRFSSPAAFVNGTRVCIASADVYLAIRCLAGGATGLYVTQFPSAVFARAPGLLLALAWLLPVHGVFSHSAPRYHSHRRWMVRNFSLTLAAARYVYLGLAVAAGVRSRIFIRGGMVVLGAELVLAGGY